MDILHGVEGHFERSDPAGLFLVRHEDDPMRRQVDRSVATAFQTLTIITLRIYKPLIKMNIVFKF